MIEPKPRSLLPEDLEVDFMGERCQLSLVHLRHKSFRLLLRPTSSLDDGQAVEAVMVDLQLDDKAFKSLFGRLAINESRDLLPKLLANTSLAAADLRSLQTVCNVDKETVWLLSGAEVLATATALATQATSHAQEYLEYRKLTLASLKSLNYLLAVKLVDWQKKRYTVFEVIETTAKAKAFTVKARNCFESYSNCRRP